MTRSLIIIERIFWVIGICSIIPFLSSCAHSLANSETQAASEESKLPVVKVVAVKSLRLERTLQLPGELRAYQDVPVHAKVEGFISWIGVDRGSKLKKGDKMITIYCPELVEKTKEAAAKLSSAESSYRQAQSSLQSEKSKLVEAQARLDADSLTFERLKQAAKTPGAIAQNEVDIQDKAVESDKARVAAVISEVNAAEAVVAAEAQNVVAAKNVLSSLKDMTSYLTITAPFDGVITERNVHEGSIVAVDPARGQGALPMVRIQEKDILRLVVAVPEDAVAVTTLGQKIRFTVPAFLGKTFYGIVARPGYALDLQTRTEPVELNVYNQDGALEPGMFATVQWHVTRPYDTMFVPSAAVASDLKGTFVVRVKDGVCERIPVQRGQTMKNLVEIAGPVNSGDLVALKAADELKTGTHLKAELADQSDIKAAAQYTASGGE